jgi:hypothetical protein
MVMCVVKVNREIYVEKCGEMLIFGDGGDDDAVADYCGNSGGDSDDGRRWSAVSLLMPLAPVQLSEPVRSVRSSHPSGVSQGIKFL